MNHGKINLIRLHKSMELESLTSCNVYFLSCKNLHFERKTN